ncbi:MAG: orotate phosphoribosyltransferase [Wenzhouxiangellaceae bacterium]|nr:orotate phosphoribosyltransferase [Wenzhouxiangellaceae bacterium]
MEKHTAEFIRLAREAGALGFGRFELKSGRVSPYFFNAGKFCEGDSTAHVADCYADAIAQAMEGGLEFDMLFGPAYKGIPLAATVAVSLYRRHGISRPWAYDRKEVKDHGEGGRIVGAAIGGRVLVVDDVLSAGTAFGEARRTVEGAGGEVVSLAVGLDRQERGTGAASAGSEIEEDGVRVIAVSRLDDLVESLRQAAPDADVLSDMLDYRDRYGA